jgi:anti-anti-sigma factor
MSSAPPTWRLLTRTLGKVTLVRITGPRLAGLLLGLDEEGAVWLRNKLLAQVELGRLHLAVDLGNVSYLTSTGVEAFLALHRRLQAVGGHLSLHNLTPPVAEIFSVLRVADVLDLDSPPPEAPRGI